MRWSAVGWPVPTFRVRITLPGIDVTILGDRHRRSGARGEPARDWSSCKEDARDRRRRWPCRREVQRRDLLRDRRRSSRGPRRRIDDPAFVCDSASVSTASRRRLRWPGRAAAPDRSGSVATAFEIDSDPSRAALADPCPNSRGYLARRAVRRERRPRDRRRGAEVVRWRDRRRRQRGPSAWYATSRASSTSDPTVSLPSALEVLRTRVGDCNEHTALYVALARAAGVPARIAVGLVYLRGAFYYHAWAEVYVETAPGRGRWLAVDPTLNQFPADLTHIRLARGGLERQAAITSMIGRVQIERRWTLEIEPGTAPIAGRPAQEDRVPSRSPCAMRAVAGRTCWGQAGSEGRPLAMIRVDEPRQALRQLHRGRRRVTGRRQPGRSTASWGPTAPGKTTTIRMIAGLAQAHRGKRAIDGHDLATRPDGREGVAGFVPDRPYLYEKLTGGRVPRFHRRPLSRRRQRSRGRGATSCWRCSS